MTTPERAPEGISRRRLLGAAGAAGVGAVAAALPAGARPAHASAAAPQVAPTITDLGPASEVTVLNGSEPIGDRIYVNTGGVSPTVVGAYDPAQKRVTQRYTLPTGQGAWATTAVGADLYVGTYAPGDLYRVDTTGTSVTKVADVRPDDFIWALDTSPDGKVYGGTYPRGRVFEYDPATGAKRDYGTAVPGEQYVRSIAVDDTTIYAGVGAHAHLMAIDRVTGAGRDILPPEFADRTFVATLALEDGLLAAGLSATGTMLLIDTADPTHYEVVQAPNDSYITAITIDAANNDVYFGTRPSGTLYKYDRDTGSLTSLLVPYDGAYFGRIVLDGRVLRGILTSNVVSYDLDTGEYDGVDITQAGMPPAPELAMAIATDGPRVYVSGKAGVQVHDLATGTSKRVFLPGEAKAMTPVRGQVWLSVYTLAYLFRMSPGAGPVRVTTLGNDQTRPLDATYSPSDGLLAVGTQPEYGRYGGALGLYDPVGGHLSVYRGVVPDQSVRSVAIKDGTVFLGSSIRNGLGTTPRAPEAKLAAFDLASRSVTYELVPVPGAREIVDLVATGDRVYGVTDTGLMFEYDPRRRQVLRTAQVATGAPALVLVGRTIYGADIRHVFRVDRSTLATMTVVDDLHTESYSGAMIAAAPDGSALYALRGRNLVRIGLEGSR
ncbi:Outer membrane protein assembly factor BamB, contains PQQ-like beta-propeller repeat [Actinopolymorpha cephalotaxi]|uniref:Outer membrane protein assembly factor BamB, contains PQQ-like beta-propeller repeat n=1 Tax=Actinopolymorpha cephalotaxi TaxID=504797 RepID=A0A1I2LJT7_9ACTN|nr:PQQ-binding-like beta-propeller repeat protein [Actinopolymorpha cephalotaxi]NYH84939.1 hypothetical protein [Actinopolymorpha cephalotaxi]SFF77326.1 Outer membrane protein assembly factor BamB, contains PQQ-like beta-propeller repeat [Actinopolymorpha cephalotaxi]